MNKRSLIDTANFIFVDWSESSTSCYLLVNYKWFPKWWCYMPEHNKLIFKENGSVVNISSLQRQAIKSSSMIM